MMKKCAFCGKEFEPVNNQAKYCSDICKKAVMREQRKKYRDKVQKVKRSKKPKKMSQHQQWEQVKIDEAARKYEDIITRATRYGSKPPVKTVSREHRLQQFLEMVDQFNVLD